MTGKNGFVAVAGRPNAGKSTLLNRIAGSKRSIVSHRRQTTRSVIRLIDASDEHRMVWLDTPGWQSARGGIFNRRLNVAAEWAAHVADVIVFLTAAGGWTPSDEGLLATLPQDKKIICALNKIDLVKNKNTLLPMMEELSKRRAFSAIVPLSAARGGGVDALRAECAALLPAQAAADGGGEEDDLAFFFAELVREKICRALGDELPYSTGVVADIAPRSEKRLDVTADIYVGRESQKPIVIGRGGATLKRIATAARRDMEKYSGKKICLTSRVRAADWWRDAALLQRMRIGLPPGA